MAAKEKETTEKAEGKKCFIITPIGGSSSEIHRHINGVIRGVIRPVLEEFGFTDVKAAHEINGIGNITNDMISRIVEDDLVIANLTDRNPNVMYELCLRHVVAKPIIHVCEEGTDLPFDIKDSRTIYYKNDIYGAEDFKNKLRDTIGEIDYSREYKDNPIYTGLRYENLFKESGEKATELELIADLSRQVSRLEAKLSSVQISSIRSKQDSITARREQTFFFQIASDTNEQMDNFINEVKSIVGVKSAELSKDCCRLSVVISNVDSNVVIKQINYTAEEFHIAINGVSVFK